MREYAHDEIQAGADRELLRQGKLKLQSSTERPPRKPARKPRRPDQLPLEEGIGGLKLDPAQRLRDQEKENSKLKRLVAELSMGKQILKDVPERNL